MSHQTAIFITTMRGDYYLAKALVSSIETHLSDPRIFVIPDDDYRRESMFGYPVFRPTDQRVLALDGYYKKMRLFWGPAERFIHMDADQLVLRDLTSYVEYVTSRTRPFLVYSRRSRWWSRMQRDGEPAHRDAVTGMVGEIDWMERFDPSVRWQSLPMINGGEFAASRDAIDHEDFLATLARARRFYTEHGLGAMTSSRRPGPFMSDQGFLSYYMSKRRSGVVVESLDDLYGWAGSIDELARFRPDDRSTPMSWVALHWAGCLRPGPIPFPGRSPLAREWRHAHRRYIYTRRDAVGYVVDVAADITRLLRIAASQLKRGLRRFFSAAKPAHEHRSPTTQESIENQ